MSDLKDHLIKLGSEEPSLRKHIRPVLNSIKTGSKSFYLIGKQSRKGFGEYQGQTMADAVVNMYEDVGYDAEKVDFNTVEVDAPSSVRLDNQIETDGPNEETVEVRHV